MFLYNLCCIISVVIDYRNDPKASTGEFELIYKQVIPPAPAYLGLNLFLKGTQIVPKSLNSIAKKEKSSQVNKINAAKVREANVTGGQITTGGSRSFLMDMFDYNVEAVDSEKKIERSSIRTKSSKVKTVMVLKKPTNLDLNSIVETNVTRVKGKTHFSLNRNAAAFSKLSSSEPTTINHKKFQAKTIESARRHASCGPRLMTVQNAPPPTENNVLQELEENSRCASG